MAPITEHWWFSCSCGFGGWAISKPAAITAMAAHADYARAQGDVVGHAERVSESHRVRGQR